MAPAARSTPRPVPAEDAGGAGLPLATGAGVERAPDGGAFPEHLMEIVARAIAQGLGAAADAPVGRRLRSRAS